MAPISGAAKCWRRFRIWERRNLAPAGLASSVLAAAIVLLGVGHAELVFVELFFVLDQRHRIIVGGVANLFFFLGEAFRDLFTRGWGFFVFIVGGEDRLGLDLDIDLRRFLDFFVFILLVAGFDLL